MAAFIKGGCFALLLFAVAATVALLFGGQAHANPGGLILLFVLGGLGGLVVNAIYYKGRKDATRDGQGGAAGVSSPNSGDRNRPGNMSSWLIAVFIIGLPFALFIGFWMFLK